MRSSSANHYERAFENWLIDNQIKYKSIDQNKRADFNEAKVKSFDFLLYRKDGSAIIAELKGRTFKGTSFENLHGFECWVFAADVDGLSKWQDEFGAGYDAFFIFAYGIENIDVDFDGRECFQWGPRRYVFLAVRLDDYRKFMKLRSPKWRTVTLGADDFRRCAIPLEELILKA
jgi:hypothetical protein